MKAVVITRPGGPEVLEFQEVPEKVPGDDEVLVQVRATALNRADLLQRRGAYPAPEGTRSDIPGLEFAGILERLGANVRGFSPGDRIMGLLPGEGYAQKVVLPASLVLPIPPELSFEEAAALPEVFLTAFDALFTQLELQSGERLLIHAVASGVGLAALQLARLAGAITFGTAGSDEKINLAQNFGLDFGINYRRDDFHEIVHRETSGQGVHALLDLVGAPYWERNLKCLAVCGRMLIVGLLGGSRIEADLSEIMRKRLRVQGTVLRPRGLAEKVALVQLFRTRVLPFFEKKRLRPVVDRIYDWQDVREAHAFMEANRNAGKIVLRVLKT